ncbi:MAG: glycosyltransferase family 2 protein [bacterium]
MQVSIVIPVFNEEDNVVPLAAELVPLQQQIPGLEIILVDDGSRDGTWAKIQACAKQHPFIRGIRSIRNGGQTSAMLIGLNHARGDIIVTLDGDLQNNPADIPAVVAELRKGDCDAVCGYRAKRRDAWSRRVGSRIANAIRNGVTHDGLRDTGCSLKAFKRECVKDLPPLNGAHRFIGAYFKLNGRRIREMPVDHRHRRHGTSKYTNLKRLPKTAFDLIGYLWYRRRKLPEQQIEETS